MNSEKISIIKGWPTPRNISEVQLFLRFINFYCRFIKRYSEIAASLINLIKKTNPKFKIITQKPHSKNLKNNLAENQF